MKRLAAILVALAALAPIGATPAIVLRYSHPNPPGSIAGRQAVFFAARVAEYTAGAATVEVYPNSALGSLAEQARLVSSGAIAIHHTTAAGIGSLFGDFAVLDTPYLYKDVGHLMRVVNPTSPVMARLNSGLVKRSGVHVLYTFYFGARELTCDRPIRRPEDLRGLKVRSLPFPIYEAAVEGLGAQPTPLDWSQTPTALSAKVVQGQENPVNTILTSKLYESQGYLMLTNHILGAEIVVVNDAVWRGLSRPVQAGVARAAAEASAYATGLTQDQEAGDLAALRAKGMRVIGPAEGLDEAAFKESTLRLVAARFGRTWAEYYRAIAAVK